jgi:uncharacterized protein (DUF58 family)
VDPRILASKLPAPTGTEGVYVGLDDLIRIQHKARGFTFLPRQPLTSLLAGRHASRLRGRGFDFEELRRYLPGDDIRTIDWRVTARTQKPHTRVFTEERDRPALLVVDQRIGMFYGTEKDLKSVTAAKIAALAAWRVESVGDRVGALVFDDEDVVEIRPRRSRNTVMRILQTITAKNQALRADSPLRPTPGTLNRVLGSAARIAAHDHLVVVISDFDGVDDDTRRHVLRLAEHNDVLLLLVHDRSALELPEHGRLVVSDGDLQVEIDAERGRERQRLLDFSTGRIQRVLGWQREIGVPVLAVTTAEEPEVQIRRQLGGRPGTRRG